MYKGASTPPDEIPVPDMFRMESPFVEGNVRFDYMFTNALAEPAADESQFFTQLSYAFTKRLGVLVAAPYLIRDNFEQPNTSGFSDLEAGVRYVAIGPNHRDPFKLALGLNVVAPTGSVVQELGDGVTVLEPELLMYQRLGRLDFLVTQIALDIPTVSGESTGFGYNIGYGNVIDDASTSKLFQFPTAIFELNGATGVGGPEAGTTILDLTPGLRWFIGDRLIAGAAVSLPVTGPREFETQFIASLIYIYGVDSSSSQPSSSSRAYF